MESTKASYDYIAELRRREAFQAKLAHELARQLGESVTEVATLRVKIEQLEIELDGANEEIARTKAEPSRTSNEDMAQIDDFLSRHMLSLDETNVEAIRRLVNEVLQHRQLIGDIVGRLNVMAKELGHPISCNDDFGNLVSILARLKEVVWFYTHGHVHEAKEGDDAGALPSPPGSLWQVEKIESLLNQHKLFYGMNLSARARVSKVIEEHQSMAKKLAEARDILGALSSRLEP